MSIFFIEQSKDAYIYVGDNYMIASIKFFTWLGIMILGKKKKNLQWIQTQIDKEIRN